MAQIPTPFSAADYWSELLRQVEVSRTIVFEPPRVARGFFEALISGNLDVTWDTDLDEVRREEWRLSPADLKPDVHRADSGEGPHLHEWELQAPQTGVS
jgi:hypothetical protein